MVHQQISFLGVNGSHPVPSFSVFRWVNRPAWSLRAAHGVDKSFGLCHLSRGSGSWGWWIFVSLSSTEIQTTYILRPSSLSFLSRIKIKNKKKTQRWLPAALHFPFLITWAGGGLFFRTANVLFITTCATSPHYIASNWIMPSVTRVDILRKYRFRVLWSHHKVRPFQSGVDRRNDNFQIWISKQRSQTCSVSLSRVWTTLERCNRTM